MNNRNIRIDGKYVIVEEVQPKYFEKIIEWRNNPEFNRFLNQPYKLTMELQQKWYEKYLNDLTQGLFVMVDKSTGSPFGTIGYTDFCKDERVCIAGRALVGNLEYRGSKYLLEGMIIFQDYLYQSFGIEYMYIHVVDKNVKTISFNKKMGYKINKGTIKFPNELSVNGMRQTEYVRTFEQYEKARKKMLYILDNI